MANETGKLLTMQAMSVHGCAGGNKDRSCYALTMGREGFECMKIVAPAMAEIAGMLIGRRVNTDPVDNVVWCPTGILENSKQAPVLDYNTPNFYLDSVDKSKMLQASQATGDLNTSISG